MSDAGSWAVASAAQTANTTRRMVVRPAGRGESGMPKLCSRGPAGVESSELGDQSWESELGREADFSHSQNGNLVSQNSCSYRKLFLLLLMGRNRVGIPGRNRFIGRNAPCPQQQAQLFFSKPLTR